MSEDLDSFGGDFSETSSFQDPGGDFGDLREGDQFGGIEIRTTFPELEPEDGGGGDGGGDGPTMPPEETGGGACCDTCATGGGGRAGGGGGAPSGGRGGVGLSLDLGECTPEEAARQALGTVKGEGTPDCLLAWIFLVGGGLLTLNVLTGGGGS